VTAPQSPTATVRSMSVWRDGLPQGLTAHFASPRVAMHYAKNSSKGVRINVSQQMDLPKKTSDTVAAAAPATRKYAFRLVLASAFLSLLAPAARLVQVIVDDVPPDVLATYQHDSPQATAEAVKTTVVGGQLVTLGFYLTAAAILAFVAKKMKVGRSWAKWV